MFFKHFHFIWNKSLEITIVLANILKDISFIQFVFNLFTHYP